MYKLLSTTADVDGLSTKDLFNCLLGLNENEIDIFKHVLDHGGETCNVIGAELGKSRSTVQRAMQKLLNLRLIEREQEFPEQKQRGYVYVYHARPREHLRRYLFSLVDEAKNRMVAILEREFSL